jgi:quercetin dioxygenase-like cupin family protein
LKNCADVRERLSRLGNDVVAADEAAFRIHWDAARDEEQVADAHRVCVVADRLRLAFDPDLLTRRHGREDNQWAMEPQFVRFDDVRAFELAPGVSGRPLFGEGAMLNLIEFEPGATVPLHSHEHEQLSIVLRGMQALVVDGEPHELGPLQGYVLPGGVEHSAYCGLEGALVLDVFRPVGQDYRERWQSES